MSNINTTGITEQSGCNDNSKFSKAKIYGSLTMDSLISGFATFISRITGFIRDIITANLFGATIGYDAFILAFRIPNLMRRLFAEGAFSQAFVPVFAEYTQQKPPAAIKLFINKIAGNLTLILILITLIGVIFSPILVKLCAPGLNFQDISNHSLIFAEKFTVTVKMLRIVFPYILFISLTAFTAGILNCYHYFAVPAFTPVLLNLSLIICSLFLAKNLATPELSLAIGVLIAGGLQLSFQLPFLAKLNLLPKLTIDWQDPGVKRVLLLMLPATLGAAIGQINILIDSMFASFLPTGSITWLYYADRLMEFPLGVFGVSFATVILPQLSKSFANQQQDKFNKIFSWGVKSALLIGAPASLGLLLLSKPLVTTLFLTGKFNINDVKMCSGALIGYAFSVLGIMLAKIFASGFYAIGDLKTPVKIGAIILIANIGLNYIFTRYLHLDHVGIAIATTIASILHAIMLYFNLPREQIKLLNFTKFAFRVGFSCLVLTGFLYFYPSCKADWSEWSIKYKFFKLTEILLLSAGIYLGTLWLIGFKWKKVLAGGDL